MVGFARPVAREMGANPIAQVPALADVQRQRVVAVEQINPGPLGHGIEDVRRKLGRKAGDPENAPDRRLDPVRRHRRVECLDELPQRLRVAQGAMARSDREPVALDHRIEAVRRGMGKRRRDRRTVHSTFALNGRASRANSCFRNP